jgi:acyl-coenzyme A thioesterase PaaI-like protein
MDAIGALILKPGHDIMIAFVSIVLGIFVAVPALCLGVIRKRTLKMNIVGAFEALKPFRGGRYIFSRVVGLFAPYSATIGAFVEHLEPGVAHCCMNDAPWKRNPFASIHAIALANLAEMTAGLAGMTALQSTKGTIGIPVGMNIEYKVKARGKLFCKAAMPSKIPETEGVSFIDIPCNISDSKGQVVATASVKWSFKVRAPRTKSD